MKSVQDAGWVLETSDRTDYSPLTVANGMIGCVPSAEPLRMASILVNGTYDRYGRDGVPRIVPGIQFADLDLRVGDGDAPSNQPIQDWRQRFDMRTAGLTTAFVQASRLRVEHTVYALRHLPHVVLVVLELTALEETSVTLRHRMAVPEPLAPQGQYLHHYEEVAGTPLLSTEATSPAGRHHLGAAATYWFDGAVPEPAHESLSEREHGLRWSMTLEAGQQVRFALIGALCTTVQVSDPLHEAERFSIFARFEGPQRLLARHEEAWEELWQGDILIEGDPVAQRDVRLALYHLYAFVRAGSRCSIPPMGLSSMGYNGHIFWDAELWMYPPLLVLQPDMARAMVDYRTDRLAAARRKAANHGFGGAMFPWESDDRGEECTPVWAVTGTSEHHITACVGIAFWNYYRITGDQAWLRAEGYPLLEQVADFWVSRVERVAAGRFEIANVVGADEYTGVVDNNAFTNGAAIIALRYATRAAHELGLNPNPLWAEVAAGIPILTFPDGTTQEYAGYDGRIVKQADANLLAYPLELIRNAERVRQDVDYYEPRFAENAPAMTHSILAVLAARLGDAERAYAFFKRAYRPNQKPPFGVLSETPYSSNPYFATAAGGMLQAVLFGFGGLALTDEGLVQHRPCLPPGWTSLTLKGVGVRRETYTIRGSA